MNTVSVTLGRLAYEALYSLKISGSLGYGDTRISRCTLSTALHTMSARETARSSWNTFCEVSSPYTWLLTKSTGTFALWTCSRNAGTHAACAVAGPPTRILGLTDFSARAVWSYSSKYVDCFGSPPQKSMLGSFHTSKYQLATSSMP